jgi:pyridoxine 4-dehydrogenase
MNANLSAVTAGDIMLGDLHINRLGFGAMRITGEGVWGEPHDTDQAMQVLKRTVELNINFIDTADAYGPEVSERLINRSLYPYDGLIIATKGGLTRSGPGKWSPDCSPDHLRDACEASLKRLKVDRIDLYQLHTVDPQVPFEDSYQTLLDLQKEGKIRYIGLSNIEPEHFNIALSMGAFVSVQNNYNLLNREHEDVLELCEEHHVMFIPYFPIGGNSHDGIAHDVLSDIAHRHHATPRQIALRWILSHSPVTVPIPGTSSVAHLEENVGAAALQLSDDDIAELNALA